MVVQAAGRYGFLDERNHTARNAWVVSSRCPHLRHELRRRGSTALEGYDTWTSADTQSYHALRSNRWIGCYYREYPMGWGMAASGEPGTVSLEHVDDPPPDFSAEDFWRWATRNTSWDIFTGTANPLANSRAVAQATAWRGRGMPGYVDVTHRDTIADRPLRFAIRAMRDQGSLAMLKRASTVRTGPGILSPSTTLPGDMIAVVSAAETWFERPADRADGHRELASLFSPYWQARLSDVQESEKAEARRRQGVL